MHVLYIAQHIHPPLGGAEISTLNLMEGLRKRGHTCSYICSSSSGDGNPPMQAEQLEDVQEAANADVICTQLSWTPTAQSIAKTYNKPLIWFFHSWEYICHVGHTGHVPSQCGQKCFKCDYRNKQFKPETTITNSLYTQRVLREQHNIDSNVIYPMADLQRVKVRSREPIFVTMPRIHYMKGTDRFFEIARHMPHVKFRIVGYGQRPAVLPENVIVCGHSDPKEFYKDTSVWVAPFRFESFGLTMVEAQYNEVPVVASNICAVKDDNLIELGETVDDPDNIHEWVAKIGKILEDPAAYRDPDIRSRMEAKMDHKAGLDTFERVAERLIK